MRRRALCLGILIPAMLGLVSCEDHGSADGTDASPAGRTDKTGRVSLEISTRAQAPEQVRLASDQGGVSSLESRSSPDSTTQPAATSQPVARFQPLKSARSGDWAEYDTLSGRFLRYEVIDKDSLRTRTRVTLWEGDRRLGEPAIREDRHTYDPVRTLDASYDPTITMEPATIEAADRTWEADLYESRWTSEGIDYVRRTWVSDEAPVMGILRMELRGGKLLEARLQLLRHGHDSKAAERTGIEPRD